MRQYPQYSNIDFCSGNIQIKQHSIHFEVNKSYMTQLNVYEFAHKCKEWAWSNGYRVIEIQKGVVWVIHKEYNILMAFNYSMICYQDIDIESACQWILDNKDKQ